MIFKLKTSKKTQEIFEEIGKSTALKPYTLVKHAIAWSLKAQGKITSFDSDTDGLELNEEYFPKYMKAHIDRGAILLESRYKHAGDLDKYVLETFGIGDTV